MKILGICCSPRKGQTTFESMTICLSAAREIDHTIDTELIELEDKNIGPCIACGTCKEGLVCSQEDDFQQLIPVLADENVTAMIIGTPVYFGSMTAQCKAFIDRCAMFRRNGWIFRDRVGGVLAVGGVRNGGQELTIQAVQTAMLCHDMICVSDGRPTAHFGAALFSEGGKSVENDDFGLETVRNLGRRVAELAVKLSGNS